MNKYASLAISALTAFIVTFGTSLTTAMMATGTAQLPSAAVLAAAGIGALTTAARDVQKWLSAPPP